MRLEPEPASVSDRAEHDLLAGNGGIVAVSQDHALGW